MNETNSTLIPEGLGRVNRRKSYEADTAHATLKNKREKRDELKEKKFQAQAQKEKDSTSS